MNNTSDKLYITANRPILHMTHDGIVALINPGVRSHTTRGRVGLDGRDDLEYDMNQLVEMLTF